MKRLVTTPRWLSALLVGASALTAQSPDALLKLPLGFEPAEAEAVLVARGAGYRIRVTGSSLSLALDGAELAGTLRVHMLGGNPAARPRAEGLLPGCTHYLLGRDPARWRRGVVRHERVRVEEVYPAIDVIAYGRGRQLEYDFEIGPRGEVSDIRLSFEGMRSMRLDRQGRLVFEMREGRIVQEAPVAWQEVGGRRMPVKVEHVLLALDTVGFRVDTYDRTRPLVIDPVVSYASYFGGSLGDVISELALDSQGNMYVAGSTTSANLPARSAFQGSLKGTYDVFVAKISADGRSLVYLTYLGGSGSYQDDERPFGIGVDKSGQAVVYGRTNAKDFPTKNAAQSTIGGAYDAFITKLSANGASLVFSTFLGGSSDDNAYRGQPNMIVGGDMTMDASGNTWVTGTTQSTNFPLRLPIQKTAGGSGDAFVAKVDPVGKLLFSSYLGGNNSDQGWVIKVDPAGAPVIAGASVSKNFPVTQGAYETNTSALAFVTKLAPSGGAILLSTRFPEIARGMAIDSAGGVYLCGGTSSSCLPVTFGAMQTEHFGSFHTKWETYGWISKLDSKLAKLEYSTYHGTASAFEMATDILVDTNGDAWVALLVDGARSSSSPSAWLMRLNRGGTALSYRMHVGIGGLAPAAIARNPAGEIVMVGSARPSSLNATQGALQSTHGGGLGDGFIAKIQDAAKKLTSLTVRTPRLAKGRGTTAIVTLDGSAPTGGTTVTLQVSPAAGGVSLPPKVVVPAGSISASFTVQATANAAEGQRLITASALGSQVSASTLVWSGPRYAIRSLGDLGSKDHYVVAAALNGLGQSTGTARLPSFQLGAFVHDDNKGMLNISSGAGTGINDRGQVSLSLGRSAALYDPLAGITTLPLPGNSSWGSATSLNQLGEVVGWYTGTNGNLPVYWDKNGKAFALPNLGGNSGTAHGINDLGQIVGESFTAQGARRAFRYSKATGIQDLGTLSGHSYAVAYQINNRGDVVGTSLPSFGSPRAFLYRNGVGMKDLGVLKGDVHSVAYDVNAHGHAVGFSAQRSAAKKQAVLFTDSGGIQQLSALLDPEQSFGWDLQEARSINDDGQILGNGTFRGRFCAQMAFRLDPVQQTSYGTGCPGTAGLVPKLSTEGDLVGGRKVHVVLADARPSAATLLLIGLKRVNFPLGLGCTIWVDPGPTPLLVPVQIDKSGSLRLPATVPAGLAGTKLLLQAFVYDNSASNGVLSMSGGLELRFTR